MESLSHPITLRIYLDDHFDDDVIDAYKVKAYPDKGL